MEEKKLTAIFISTYRKLYSYKKNNSFYLKINDPELFEKNLLEYLISIYGVFIKYNLHLYYPEISKSFENIIVNGGKQWDNIEAFVLQYGENFYDNINKYPLSSNFIYTIGKIYSKDHNRVVINNFSKSYCIGKIERKGEESIPNIIIKNIETFENILFEFVNAVKKSDTYFNAFFSGMEEDDAISYLFEWVTRNASPSDMQDIEQYYMKYTSFIIDDTFDNLKNSVKIGSFFGDNLFVRLKKANVNYETPYYISFMLNSDAGGVELPVIRLGIERKKDKKIAHILATQTSQEHHCFEHYSELNECFKKMFDKSKYFRDFNPSHVVSLILCFGLLKGMGINKVEVVTYLPLRMQRLILEGQKSEEEIYDLQYRLTNKNVSNYLRLREHFNDINVDDYYLDINSNLSILLGDNISSENLFFQTLYNLGYNAGVSHKIDESNEKKNVK